MCVENPVSLGENNWAIMVHKKYMDRVIDYLWKPVETTVDQDQAKLPVLILDLPQMERGCSQSRRGYRVVMGQQQSRSIRNSPLHLSAFARQNISWMARMQWRLTCKTMAATTATTTTTSPESMTAASNFSWQNQLARHLYTTLIQGDSASLARHKPSQTLLQPHDKIRVDVYPRHHLENVVGPLQQNAAMVTNIGSSSDKNSCSSTQVSLDPFDGPLPLTASRTNCTIRITVVVVQQSSPENATASNIEQDQFAGTAATTCYWGIDRRPRDTACIDVKLNHEAHEEFNIVPMLPKDGSEPTCIGSTSLSLTTPLSRAYFKLDQVWDELLATHPWLSPNCKDAERNTEPLVAMDVGASPGGWTQHLLHAWYSGRIRHVYAMDKAQLAQRILSTGRVTHIPCRMHQFASQCKECPIPPLSVLVCDASVLWAELWESLAQHVFPHIQWRLPAVIVLTCKLPFVTKGSIARHVERIQQQYPIWWKEHLQAMFETAKDNENALEMEWHLLHLFANSESERTLVVIIRQKNAQHTTDIVDNGGPCMKRSKTEPSK